MIMRVLFLFLCAIGTLHAPALTISTPGLHQLSGNIDYDVIPTPTDSIVHITSGDVIFDLMGYALTHTGNAAGISGISVHPGLSNITIRNGSVLHPTETGISIANNCAHVVISNIFTSSAGLCGIAFNNQSQMCYLSNCTINYTGTGIVIHQGTQNSIQNNIIAHTTLGIQLVGGSQNNINTNTITDLRSTQTIDAAFVAGIITDAQEQGTSLVNNTIKTTTVLGAAHAYGIKLSYTLGALESVLSYTHNIGITVIRWSPDSRFVAVAGGPLQNKELYIYQFDGTSLTPIASARHGASINSIDWSSDGTYLAIGGLTSTGIETRIYIFDGVILTEVTYAAHGSTVHTLNWSPDGTYLATGETSYNGEVARLYTFSSNILIPVDTLPQSGTIHSLNWSADGTDLAISGNTSNGVEVRIFHLDDSELNLTLTLIHGAAVYSVNWSHDGRYLALGGESAGGVEGRVYEFTGTALVEVGTVAHGAPIYDISWSSDGAYIVFGGVASDAVEARIYRFDGTVLTPVTTIDYNTSINSIHWAKNGVYIAAVTDTYSQNIYIHRALTFAQNMIISNNAIQNIIGNPVPVGTARGVGISASSRYNTVVTNTLSGCDIDYEFVENT